MQERSAPERNHIRVDSILVKFEVVARFLNSKSEYRAKRAGKDQFETTSKLEYQITKTSPSLVQSQCESFENIPA